MNGFKEGAPIKKPSQTAEDRTSRQRILAFALVMSTLASVPSWICLFAVLRPGQWLLASNMAQWVWIAFNFVSIALFLGALLYSRLIPQPKEFHSQLKWGSFHQLLFLLIMIALLVGHIVPALILSYLKTSLHGVREMCVASGKPKSKLPQAHQFENALGVLLLAVLILALSLHSIQIAVVLVGIEIGLNYRATLRLQKANLD